jgi:LmbE family N-acetylglucosaminyl deacetylase
MISLSLGANVREALFLGAHCDDIEIGCGGTLAALALACPQVKLHAVVFSGNDVRQAETRAAFARLLPAGFRYELEFHRFQDGFFPEEWRAIKESMEALRKRVNPDVVFTHYEKDRHQDHRAICELTWNTFRNQLVLEYEIPKWDGDLGQPGFYVPLAPQIVELKTNALLESFPSQAGKRWFTRDLFASLMRIRGMECNAGSGFAEAFYARKVSAGW